MSADGLISSMSTLGKAAIAYAESGYRVFPLRPRKKEPLTAHGVKDATTNLDQIRQWWTANPDANIGLATGSGVMALDIDGPEGANTLAALEQKHGTLPVTPVQFTGKGRHYLFSVTVEVRNTSRRIGAGVDTRGDGGYIVVAPSIHPSGSSYAWDQERRPFKITLAPAPVWLLALLTPKISEMASVGFVQRPDPEALSDNYVQRALDGEFDKVSGAPLGRRNDTLNTAAFNLGQLVGANVLAESVAQQTLEAAASHWGPLSRRDREKITAGLRAGFEKPRQIKPRMQTPRPRQQRSNDGPHWSEGEDRLQDEDNDEPPPLASLTPSAWHGVDPKKIRPRQWLYDRYLCRGVVSLTISPGGVGKSTLSLTEALAMVTNRSLLDQIVSRGPHRVWSINLEDPRDELDRRLAAACLHYRISDDDIAGRLFIDSGIDTPLITASISAKGKAELNEAVFEHLEEQIRSRGIDAIIVDPFISSHELPENDNQMIDRVAKRWAALAQRCDIAVGLVHHTRKTGGQENDSESARGASSLVAAARIVRVLNGMSKDEATLADIPELERRSYFRLSRDKQNLSPPESDRNWFRMLGVELGNATPPLHLDGDEVGIPTRWQWPSAFDGIDAGALRDVQDAINGLDLPESPQATKWAGHTIGEVLNIDTTDKVGAGRVKQLIKKWIASGALKIEKRPNPEKGRDKPVLVVGELAERVVSHHEK
jgi:hypothetical protein